MDFALREIAAMGERLLAAEQDSDPAAEPTPPPGDDPGARRGLHFSPRDGMDPDSTIFSQLGSRIRDARERVSADAPNGRSAVRETKSAGVRRRKPKRKGSVRKVSHA